MPKVTEDQQLQRWGKRLQERADKALRNGKISFVDYRDISRAAFRAMRPRDCAKVSGLGVK